MQDGIIELKLNNLFDKYNFDKNNREDFMKITRNIIYHPEFKRRMSDEFFHHADITLGEHILEDAIETYLLFNKDSKYRLDLAIKIALLHDLYTLPWQNNSEARVKHFFDKHGFRHPIEAVINSITWYPELFQDGFESEIIIDGILHHMFPLPVRYLNERVELKNKELYYNIDEKYKQIINNSLKRKKVGPISFTRSKYYEGRIMAKADRKISRKQIKNFSSFTALLTGHNKKINKNK